MITNMGEKYHRLTLAMEKVLGTENLILLSNGHMSLELVLQAMQLEGEVITTPFTFASTTHAIVRSGLTPVFCDIREDNYTIDTDRIEDLITDRTCAILPVHVYGNVCDVEKIEAIAVKHGLKVIYDAAHSFGVSYKGQGIGTYGDASIYSFHATKVFTTIEGGAVAVRDRKVGQAIRLLSNFGIADEDDVASVGTNAKVNEFEAATVVDERVACDACRIVIGLGESAVDDHQSAVCFDGAFAACYAYGHMPVDDVSMAAFDAKSIEDSVAYLGVVAQLVVVAFLLLVRPFVTKKIALEGGHAVLVEERGVLSAPEVPEVVLGELTLVMRRVGVEGCTHGHPDVVQEVAATIPMAVEVHLLERAVGI